MADDDIWRKRFQAMMGIRLLGVLTFFAGIAIAYTDLLRAGGWPQVGAVLALVGAIDTIWAPIVLKRGWDKADRR